MSKYHYGIEQYQKPRYFSKIIILFIFMLFFTTILFIVFLKHYQPYQTLYKYVYIINQTNTTIISNTMLNSPTTTQILNDYTESKQKIITAGSSALSSTESRVKYLYNSRFNPTTFLTTTTINLDYTSYKMRVPEKFKYCRPIEIKGINNTIIPADKCIIINESCCDCKNTGGRQVAITEKYYSDYYQNYLHNCSFSIVCRMGESPTGCNNYAACISGRCVISTRN